MTLKSGLPHAPDVHGKKLSLLIRITTKIRQQVYFIFKDKTVKNQPNVAQVPRMFQHALKCFFNYRRWVLHEAYRQEGIIQSMKMQVRITQSMKMQVRIAQSVKMQVRITQGMKMQVRIIQSMKMQLGITQSKKMQTQSMKLQAGNTQSMKVQVDTT